MENAYTIRLQVLQMAKDLVMDNYYTNKEFGRNSKTPPTFPTNTEIIDKAEALYVFVSKKA